MEIEVEKTVFNKKVRCAFYVPFNLLRSGSVKKIPFQKIGLNPPLGRLCKSLNGGIEIFSCFFEAVCLKLPHFRLSKWILRDIVQIAVDIPVHYEEDNIEKSSGGQEKSYYFYSLYEIEYIPSYPAGFLHGKARIMLSFTCVNPNFDLDIVGISVISQLTSV